MRDTTKSLREATQHALDALERLQLALAEQQAEITRLKATASRPALFHLLKRPLL